MNYSPYCHYMQGPRFSIAYIERSGSQAIRNFTGKLENETWMMVKQDEVDLDLPVLGFIRNPGERLRSSLDAAPHDLSRLEWLRFLNGEKPPHEIPPWLRPQSSWVYVSHAFRFEMIDYLWEILFGTTLPPINVTKQRTPLSSPEKQIAASYRYFEADLALYKRSLFV